jgi:hypothetical protein
MTVAILGLVVCIVAALRVAPTPLFVPAVVLAAINAACLVARLVLTRRPDATAPRALTAIQHVTVALGGFFLFVSLSLP